MDIVIFLLLILVSSAYSLECAENTKAERRNGGYCSMTSNNISSLEVSFKGHAVDDGLESIINAVIEANQETGELYNIRYIILGEVYKISGIERNIRLLCFKNFCNTYTNIVEGMKMNLL